MSKTKVVIAESSDIMLNGIENILKDNTEIKIAGKFSRYNHLCQFIDKHNNDLLVVLGPMISEKYRQLLVRYLKRRYPYQKVVQLQLDDNYAFIQNKINNLLSL